MPDNVTYLGGGVPEATVFEFIYERRVDLSGIVRQRCLLAAFPEERIVEAIQSVRNSACDPHVLYEALSQRLGFVSALRIRSGMIDIFNENNPDFWSPAIEFIQDRIVVPNT